MGMGYDCLGFDSLWQNLNGAYMPLTPRISDGEVRCATQCVIFEGDDQIWRTEDVVLDDDGTPSHIYVSREEDGIVRQISLAETCDGGEQKRQCYIFDIPGLPSFMLALKTRLVPRLEAAIMEALAAIPSSTAAGEYAEPARLMSAFVRAHRIPRSLNTSIGPAAMQSRIKAQASFRRISRSQGRVELIYDVRTSPVDPVEVITSRSTTQWRKGEAFLSMHDRIMRYSCATAEITGTEVAWHPGMRTDHPELPERQSRSGNDNVVSLLEARARRSEQVAGGSVRALTG